jgi:hypothetical protein
VRAPLRAMAARRTVQKVGTSNLAPGQTHVSANTPWLARARVAHAHDRETTSSAKRQRVANCHRQRPTRVGREGGLILPMHRHHRERLAPMSHESPDLGCGYTASDKMRIAPVRQVIIQTPARHCRFLDNASHSGPESIPHRTEAKHERDSCIGNCVERGPNPWRGFVRLVTTPRW